jgi:quercetin dioxygenase-like cupin family protein
MSLAQKIVFREKSMQDLFINQIEDFLLGTLEHSEKNELLEHLASGCDACNKAIAAATRVMKALPWAWFSPVELVEPPASLKQRILNSLTSAGTPATGDKAGAQIWKTWPATKIQAAALKSGLVMVRAQEGEWENIGLSGIQTKRLFVDEPHDSVTMLVRMPPGASYPRHRHAGPEQCLVLEGDLHIGDLVLHAGDYQCAIADSRHDVQYTEGGCVLFIVSSLHDEIIDEADG